MEYLINLSFIWLACLLVYDLLLRRESFHQYNRIYLLASLAAGLLLPMVNFNSLVPEGNTVLRQPVAQVYEMKKSVFIDNTPATIVSPAKPVAQTASETWLVDLQQILWLVYLSGLVIGLIIVGRETAYLIRMYNRGSKTIEDGYVIVETGQLHGPFSFFKIIFLRSRQDYNEGQRAVLMAHEKEHGRRLHSIDNILLIVLRLLFWFHPLPHIYYKRLIMVHEFQADAVAATGPVDYGAFLLEQTFLRGTPTLTHSFNYSPIKKQIAMLTGKKSTQARLLKFGAIVPLSILLIIFCTQTSFSEGISSKKEYKVRFKGNEIMLGTYKVYPPEYVEVLKKQQDAFLYASLPDSLR